jgi:hypothetical protein
MSNMQPVAPTRAVRFAGMIAAVIVLLVASAPVFGSLADTYQEGTDKALNILASLPPEAPVPVPKRSVWIDIGKVLIFIAPAAVFWWLRRSFKRSVYGVISAPGTLDRLLHSPTQRALFVLACLGLMPWLVVHLVLGLWLSDGAEDYLRSAFVDPFAPWFKSGLFWSIKWHDWLVLPSIIFLFLAFSWPYTGARLNNWIRHA